VVYGAPSRIHRNLDYPNLLQGYIPTHCQTRDVSKAGVSFISSQIFNVRDEVYITLPFTGQSIPVETKGRVVWTVQGPAGRYYGVAYMK